jgi:cyclic pyranopterin phosphate synthase
MKPVKLNAVIMRNKNENEVCQLLNFAMKNNCEQRFLEVMPIGHGASIYSTDFVSADTVMNALKENYTLTPIGRENGSSAVRYQATDKYGKSGTVGFISPCTAPFCADCRRLRITPDGSLVGCLARGSAIPIRNKIFKPESFLDTVSTVLGEKRTDALFSQSKIMATIGG